MHDLIYALFGKRIARRMAENYYRPKGFTDMTQAFSDTEGRLYYTWRDVGELPTIRFGKVQTLLRLADAGLSQDERKTIGNDILRLNDKLLRAKSEKDRSMLHAELAVMCKELLIEGAEVIPEDVYYELAATCVVRDDEKEPRAIDRTIHEQKYAYLKDAGIRGADFFLHMPAFNGLLRASLTSEAGLMELLPIWSKEKRRRQTIREVFEQRPDEQRRTSSNSSAGSPITTKPLTKPL